MCVVVCGEYSEDIVVFMYWFPVVSSFLLVPPVSVWISVLSFLCWWVYVAAVLEGVSDGLVELGDGERGREGGYVPYSDHRCRLERYCVVELLEVRFLGLCGVWWM